MNRLPFVNVIKVHEKLVKYCKPLSFSCSLTSPIMEIKKLRFYGFRPQTIAPKTHSQLLPNCTRKKSVLSLLFKHCVVFIVINLLPLGLANFPTRLCRHKSKSLSSVKNEIQIQANPAFCLAQLILSLTFFFHSCDKISSFCKFHFFFSHRRQIL